MSTLYSTLQRLYRDNKAEIDQYGPGLSPEMKPYVDGLQAANARILAAIAGVPRQDQPTMSKDQVEAWVRQQRGTETTHPEHSPPSTSASYPAGQVPTHAIEGEILPPEPRAPDAPAS